MTLLLCGLNFVAEHLQFRHIRLVARRARRDSPFGADVRAKHRVLLLLMFEHRLCVINEHATIVGIIAEAFKNLRKVVNCAFLLELLDLHPILVWDANLSRKLVVGLGQLILAEERSKFQLVLLIILVLLVNMVLDLSFQLTGHFTHWWRNCVAQDLIHSGSRLQGLGDGIVEFDEVLLVRHRNLRVVRNLLEEDGLGLFFSHLEMFFRRFKLFLVVRLIVGRNNINNGLAAEEDLIGALSRTSSDAHVGTLILCLREAADSEHLPGACLEVELVVALDLGEMLVLEVCNHLVQLTFLV